MKKIMCILLALLSVAFCLCGCAKPADAVVDSTPDTEEKVEELTMEEIKAISDEFMGGIVTEEFAPSKLTMSKIVNYGEIVKSSYFSTTINKNKNVIVLLPAGYDEAKEYPVMYVLHGIFGDETSMIGNGDSGLRILIGNMIADGLAEEMIVVFPAMFTSATSDVCTAIDEENSKAYDNFLNDLTVDLMPWLEENYSIKTGRDNTAVIGFSMGGRESLAIGLAHADKFGYVGAIAPAPGLVPAQDWAMKHYGQYAEEDVKYPEYTPYLTLICSGDNDHTVGTFPKSYHELYEKNGVNHVWYEISGSDHGDPAISSGIYNFCMNVFKAR